MKKLLFIIVCTTTVMYGATEWLIESDDMHRDAAPAAVPAMCEPEGMTAACAEQLINDFNGADWFVEQSLPMIPEYDRIFLKEYLQSRRLELWGELGTPVMVKRKLFWMPVHALFAQGASLLGLAGGSFTLGAIMARDCEKSYSIGHGYVNDSVVAGSCFAASLIGALLHRYYKNEAEAYQKKLGQLEAVEALVSLIG